MFDVRSSSFATHALIGPGCNRLPPPLSLQFTVRFCRPTRPSTCVVFLPRQVRVYLSSKKSTFWSAHLLSSGPPLSRFPTPTQPTQFQCPLALKHPVCRPEISGKILKIRCNSWVPVGREIKIAVVFFQRDKKTRGQPHGNGASDCCWME